MLRTPICFAIAALVITTPVGAEDEAPRDGVPHRPWGVTITLDMTVNEAQTCVARELDRKGTALILPRSDGADIDYTLGGGLFVQNMGEPQATFIIRDGLSVTLTARYRHPFSARTITSFVNGMKKRCLMVAGDGENAVADTAS